MVEIETSLELKSFQEDNPDLLYTTDFYPIEMFLGTIANQAQATSLPTDAGNMVLHSDEEASPVDWDANNYLASYAISGGGQAWAFIRAIAYGDSWPATFTDNSDYEIFYDWYLEFSRGVRSQAPRLIKDDHTAATELLDLYKAYNLDDDGGTGTHCWEWYRRFAYWFGTYYRKLFPMIADRLDSTTETARIRTIIIMASRACYEFSWVLPMMAAQSERAMLALGAMIAGLISKKVDRDAMSVSSIDEMWYEVMKTHKYNAVSDNINSGNEMLGIDADFFDFSALNLGTLDESIQRYGQVYRVPALAVNLARQLCGVGFYDNGLEQKHFIHLLNLIPAASEGAFTGHAIDEFFVGYNYASVLEYLNDTRTFETDWYALIKNRKHWTWTDLEAFAEFLVNFDLTTSLNGFCNGNIYPALKRHFAFTSANKTGTPPAATYYPNTARKFMVGTNAITDGDPDTWKTSHSTTKKVEFAWIWQYIWKGQNHNWRLVSYGELDTIEKIAIDFIVGILYDVEDIGAVGVNDRMMPHMNYHIYVHAIDARKKTRVGLMTNKTAVPVKRIGAYHNVLAHTSDDNYPYTHLYGLCLSVLSHAFTPHWMAARPKLWDKEVLYIENYGEPAVKLKMFDAMSAIMGAQSPVKIEEKPPATGAPSVGAKVPAKVLGSPKGDPAKKDVKTDVSSEEAKDKKTPNDPVDGKGSKVPPVDGATPPKPTQDESNDLPK